MSRNEACLVILLVVVSALLASRLSHGQAQGGPREAQEGADADGDTIRSVEVAGQTRRYRIHVPGSVDRSRPAPVVLAFHGGGGNPESMVRLSGLSEKADEEGFVVVYPYGSGRDPERRLTFNAGYVGGYAKAKNVDDVAFTRHMLDDLERVVAVDRDRVFATGISNGAMMAYRVAAELADRIAAVAPVGGPMGVASCEPSRPVSVIHFHGTADELAPFEGGRGKVAGAAVFRPRFTSARDSVAMWVEANGCDPTPEKRRLQDAADDGMSVTSYVWSGGRAGSEVVLIEIEGGGHTWPGRPPLRGFLGKSTRDISANNMMWDFFQKHARTDRLEKGSSE